LGKRDYNRVVKARYDDQMRINIVGIVRARRKRMDIGNRKRNADLRRFIAGAADLKAILQKIKDNPSLLSVFKESIKKDLDKMQELLNKLPEKNDPTVTLVSQLKNILQQIEAITLHSPDLLIKDTPKGKTSTIDTMIYQVDSLIEKTSYLIDPSRGPSSQIVICLRLLRFEALDLQNFLRKVLTGKAPLVPHDKYVAITIKQMDDLIHKPLGTNEGDSLY
jgi:hypothetical protein